MVTVMPKKSLSPDICALCVSVPDLCFLQEERAKTLFRRECLGCSRQYDSKHNASFKTFAEWCIRNRLRSAVKSASSLKHDPLNNRVPLESILSDESQTQAVACAELFQKSPEEQVLARENKKYTEQLYLSLVSMLSKYEKAVLTYYLEGLSYKEIAKLTGKGDKAVDNAIQRIRRKTAQMLKSGDISNS